MFRMGYMESPERAILSKIAYWYYKRHLTQAEIAQRLHLSRQRVNQMIGSLVDLGIVEIRIVGEDTACLELEHRLESALSLKQVFVIDQEDDSLSMFGERAADALSALIMDGQVIGVSWGRTLSAVIERMETKRRTYSTVVQLVGGRNSFNKDAQSDEITRTLAERLQCDYNLLYAPAIIENRQARDLLLADDAISATFSMMRRCDIAILGIGELRDNSTIFQQSYIGEPKLRALQEMGCVGDIAMHPFNAEGRLYPDDTIIGADPNMLRDIPMVVAVACGDIKGAAVAGALRTGLIDALIIDQSIAEYILKDYGIA